ncbi:MAG: hypothetical protein JWR61_1138 [Ferruginibacter sp.]|uniref:hypothetical protein n=1 Tax=Ferruginibacter sp. TaxID=1940288 RepID=UPI002657FE61|nr:hypothetical protein [Ferruginibacter sp.]MDB5276183.1 hypothetical protein [Ferruginibacter sp.]
MKTYQYNNLTELLLTLIRERPGMYLGLAKISKLPNFILGYQFCSNISQNEIDFYFGEKGFIEWYTSRYNPAQTSFWQDYFLAETGNDEHKALTLYFTRLEEYHNWYMSQLREQTETK